MDTIAKRLRSLLENKGITVYKLCKDTGLNNTTVGRILNSGTKPHDSTLDKICEYFKVDKQWLITGDGFINGRPKRDIALENIIDKEEIEIYKSNKYITLDESKKIMLVPFVDRNDQSSFIENFNNVKFIDKLPYHPIIVDSYHKGTYFSFTVCGNGMDDGSKNSIEDKSIVTGLVIDRNLWNSRFRIQEYNTYIIVHHEAVVVKQIIGHDVDNNTITIHSLNKLYADEVVNLDNCLMILEVIDINKKP